MANDTSPVALFRAWFDEAADKLGLDHASAMTLATVDEQGMPWARMVLLRALDKRGFVFYTNLESPKSRQLMAYPQAALCFYWALLGRQVCVHGVAERVGVAEAEHQFATRSRRNQLSIWASRQSQPLEDRAVVEARAAEFAQKFGADPIPRPPFWSGYCVVPHRIEFWSQRPDQLHARLLFTRTNDGWHEQTLYP
jgi:pyridoxamine 5'-phosphate oxidase